MEIVPAATVDCPKSIRGGARTNAKKVRIGIGVFKRQAGRGNIEPIAERDDV
jgi:hypothetical protein